MLLTGAATTAGFSASFDCQHVRESVSFTLNSPVSSDITTLTRAAPQVRHAGSRSAPAHRLVARTRVHGLVTGSYTTPFTLPDLGHAYDFTGTGTIAPLGGVTVAGRINTPGFIASGFAAGQLTLTGPRGSVTLSLKGPREPGFGPLPRRIAFTVALATGSDFGMRASGHVTIHLNENMKTFVMVFGN